MVKVIFVDTTSGSSITVNLPASPGSAGAIVSIQDYQ